MIIDWQHHFATESLFKKFGGKHGQAMIKDGKVGLHVLEEMYKIDMHVDFMDAAGIDMALLSGTLETVQECKENDDLFHEMMKEYPDRFVGFAPCIPTRGQEALDELVRAIHELGLKGVVISPQNDSHGLDSKEMWPFYRKVSHLSIPIFVHITNIPVGYDAMDAAYSMNVTLTREFDIAANTVRLILGGVLAEFPDLRIVMPHFGGGISSILERVERYVETWGEGFWTELGGTPPFDKPYKENFRKYFDRLYFDMAGLEGGMNGVQCALTTISPKRLLFATDYPFNFTKNSEGAKQYINNIKNLPLPQEEIEGILGGTAAKLLGL